MRPSTTVMGAMQLRPVVALCVGVCLPNLSHATDSFYSEASHFLGGSLVGGGTAYAVDRFWPQYSENRILIGCAVATAGSVLGEIYDRKHGHPARFSVLDVTAASLGGLVGATATDRWILSPVVKSEHGARYYGLASQFRF